MIVCKVTYDCCDKPSSLILIGHGGLEKGSDIYCAAVSSCFIGAINTLESKDDYDVSIKSGDSYIKVLNKISNHDEVVFETLITQLTTIATSYPKYVRVDVSRKEKEKWNLILN